MYLDKHKPLTAAYLKIILFFGYVQAVQVTMVIIYPKSFYPYHPYALESLPINTQSIHMVLNCLLLLFRQYCKSLLMF